jgi:hypothetical protein
MINKPVDSGEGRKLLQEGKKQKVTPLTRDRTKDLEMPYSGEGVKTRRRLQSHALPAELSGVLMLAAKN